MDQDQFKSEMDNITSNLKNISNKENISNISRAIGSIVAKESVKSLNAVAKADRSQYHHLYEWNQNGRDSARLVKAKRVVKGSSINIEFVFKKSNTKVPVSKKLSRPGRTGKFVSRNSVFKNKAEVIESGRSVSWTAKRNVVFLSNNSIVFKKKGTVFNISNPGGTAAHGALTRFSKKWESGMANGAIEKSKLFIKIEKDIAKTMSMENFKSSDIRDCIKIVCNQYDSRQQEF